MAEITWTKWSVKDLRSIYRYISNDSQFYAERFVRKLIFRVGQLENQPESGRVVPEKNDSSIRELIEGNYRIIYRYSKGKVTVLRIHNSARRIQ